MVEEPMGSELEIYSWWSGDEGPSLEALIELYNGMYPDVEVINATVAGGSGTEAKANARPARAHADGFPGSLFGHRSALYDP